MKALVLCHLFRTCQKNYRKKIKFFGLALFIYLFASYSLCYTEESKNVDLVGSLAGGLPYEVVVAGDYAYVAAGSVLYIINVSDPAAPFEEGFYDTPLDVYGVFVAGDYAYVADGSLGLCIIDVSDSDAPFGFERKVKDVEKAAM